MNLLSPSPSLGIVHLSLCSLSCLRSFLGPVNCGSMACLNLPFPVFWFGHVSSCYSILLVEFAVRPTSRKFSLLACFDLSVLCTRVSEILFCYLCSVVQRNFHFASSFYIFSPKPVCNFLLLVAYIYVLCHEIPVLRFGFPQPAVVLVFMQFHVANWS